MYDHKHNTFFTYITRKKISFIPKPMVERIINMPDENEKNNEQEQNTSLRMRAMGWLREKFFTTPPTPELKAKDVDIKNAVNEIDEPNPPRRFRAPGAPELEVKAEPEITVKDVNIKNAVKEINEPTPHRSFKPRNAPDLEANIDLKEAVKDFEFSDKEVKNLDIKNAVNEIEDPKDFQKTSGTPGKTRHYPQNHGPQNHGSDFMPEGTMATRAAKEVGSRIKEAGSNIKETTGDIASGIKRAATNNAAVRTADRLIDGDTTNFKSVDRALKQANRTEQHIDKRSGKLQERIDKATQKGNTEKVDHLTSRKEREEGRAGTRLTKAANRVEQHIGGRDLETNKRNPDGLKKAYDKLNGRAELKQTSPLERSSTKQKRYNSDGNDRLGKLAKDNKITRIGEKINQGTRSMVQRRKDAAGDWVKDRAEDVRFSKVGRGVDKLIHGDKNNFRGAQRILKREERVLGKKLKSIENIQGSLQNLENRKEKARQVRPSAVRAIDKEIAQLQARNDKKTRKLESTLGKLDNSFERKMGGRQNADLSLKHSRVQETGYKPIGAGKKKSQQENARDKMINARKARGRTADAVGL